MAGGAAAQSRTVGGGGGHGGPGGEARRPQPRATEASGQRRGLASSAAHSLPLLRRRPLQAV